MFKNFLKTKLTTSMSRGMKKSFGVAYPHDFNTKIHSTTILTVRKDGELFMIGDGQCSQGYTVVKNNARKVREIKKGIVCGFAGSVSDAFSLLEKLEVELDKYEGFPLLKPCIELSKQWRQSKYFIYIFGESIRGPSRPQLSYFEAKKF